MSGMFPAGTAADPDAGQRANNCILITPPDGLVVSLSEAREHLRIDAYGSPPSNPEDGVVLSLLQAAQEEMDGWEGDLGRCLLPQVWEYRAPYFTPFMMTLPLPPLRSVISVKYLDQTGAEQTLDPSTYRVLLGGSRPGGIIPVAGAAWPQAGGPDVGAVDDAVRIRFEAGYDDVSLVPYPIKSWIKQRVGQFFDNRENIVIGTIVTPLPGMDALIDRYRVRRVFQ